MAVEYDVAMNDADAVHTDANTRLFLSPAWSTLCYPQTVSSFVRAQGFTTFSYAGPTNWKTFLGLVEVNAWFSKYCRIPKDNCRGAHFF